MFEIYINNKTKHRYVVIDSSIINATNAQDGQVMVLYKTCDEEITQYFVREYNEFFEKFTREEDVID